MKLFFFLSDFYRSNFSCLLLLFLSLLVFSLLIFSQYQSAGVNSVVGEIWGDGGGENLVIFILVFLFFAFFSCIANFSVTNWYCLALVEKKKKVLQHQREKKKTVQKKKIKMKITVSYLLLQTYWEDSCAERHCKELPQLWCDKKGKTFFLPLQKQKKGKKNEDKKKNQKIRNKRIKMSQNFSRWTYGIFFHKNSCFFLSFSTIDSCFE